MDREPSRRVALGRRTRQFSQPRLPAFRQLQYHPAEKRFSNLETFRPGQGIAPNETSTRMVMPAPAIFAATLAGELHEAPIVKKNEVIERSRQFGGKHGLGKRHHSPHKWLGDYAQIIKSEVNTERELHEIVVAHVFVFVFVEGLKPTLITLAKILICTWRQEARHFRLSAAPV